MVGRSSGGGRGWIRLLAIWCLGCAGAPPPRRPPVSTTDRLDALARDLFERLTSGDADRVRSLRLEDDLVLDLFEAGFSQVILDQRRMDGGGPERVSREWGSFSGARYAGYCARRVGAGGSDLPGLVQGTDAVGELTLAGRDAAGDWAGLVRDLVRTPSGYRLVRWSVEAPRREHFDLEQWICDFSRRPY